MIDAQRLLASGCASSGRVGIGLSRDSYEKTVSKLADLACRARLSSFDDAHGLVAALQGGEIDVAVRGTMSSSKVLQELKDTYRVEEVMRTAILEAATGKAFLLTPVGIDEGRDYGSRLRMVRSTISYFSPVGWDLRIGILSKGRPEDVNRGCEIMSSIGDGGKLTEALEGDGLDVRHFSILVEDAVRECDLVVAPDGVAGNLMFRTLHFVGGRNAYGAPVVNIPEVFVDTSRAKSDFSDAVLLGLGLFKARSGRL